ncbi:MAG: tail fiber protein [Opitutae bacterium]|nr:tail fiber protein [Opitutae bacterium]
MSDPFVGEIRLVPWNWAPDGWFLCNGQTLPITQYQALYALIGITYGGDGRTNFMLPNLQGRVVGGLATNPSTCPQGVTFNRYSAIAGYGGTESGTGAASYVSLAAANLPGHTHPATFSPTSTGPLQVTANVAVANTGGSIQDPTGNILAKSQQPARTPIEVDSYVAATGATGQLGGVTTTVSGGITGGTVAVQTNNAGTPAPIAIPGSTVPVLQPYLVLNYIIAWQGIFPTRP